MCQSQAKVILLHDDLGRILSKIFVLFASLRVLLAYDKNIFETIHCPVSREEVETYLSFLKPAYLFSIQLQYQDS